MRKQKDSYDYRRELQAAKVYFMSRQRRHQALCSLRQTETRPQIYRQRRNDKGSNEASADRSRAVPSFYQRPEQHDQEHRKREYLKCKTSQQDIVWCRRVLLVRISYPDQSSPGDLYNRGCDIANDEEPKDQLRWHWRIIPAIDADHDGNEGVDRRREEDRRDHDEEVLLLLAFVIIKECCMRSPGPQTKEQSTGFVGSTVSGKRIRRFPSLFLQHLC
jgi:hypothetical protein